jgi:rare lipoprotein A
VRPEILAAILFGLAASMAAEPSRAEIASYYSDKFAGRPMAWGEPYRPESPTCAHRTHPRNTLLKVTHRGRIAFCRVNDRGPFVAGRHIDVSRAVASGLGLIEAGVGEVIIRIARLGVASAVPVGSAG